MIGIAYAVISGIIAMLSTVGLVKSWIGVAKREGLVGKDINKKERPEVAEAGGIWAIISSVFGFLIFEAIYAFLENRLFYLLDIYSIVILLILSSILGFLDDMLGWKKGVPAWIRIVAMVPMALPLMISKRSSYVVSLPFFNKINFGPIYPLVIIPIGVLGASNAFNMIAGYNGLEAGMGLTLLIFTLIFGLIKGINFVVYSSIIMIGSLIGFLVFNRYPAKVFPGNTFTYAIGAFYAGLIVLGDIPKFGLTIFFLYYIELILFIRGLLHGIYKENFGKVNNDNSLDPPYDRSYSLTHISIKVLKKIKGKANEKDVVYFLVFLQSIVGIISLILYL
ncbi:MAG: MraY family glycosyltransferase [Caldisphaera sp.]|jgi:UDP-N-acetylglucosamine--dolichyl-phosphate N-acetylglucosaminephosphotransferase